MDNYKKFYIFYINTCIVCIDLNKKIDNLYGKKNKKYIRLDIKKLLRDPEFNSFIFQEMRNGKELLTPSIIGIANDDTLKKIDNAEFIKNISL